MKEFNLKEKIKEDLDELGVLYVRDVKEFIKLYLDWLKEKECHCEDCSKAKIIKLSGFESEDMKGGSENGTNKI